MVSNNSTEQDIYLRSMKDTDSPHYFEWINNRELVIFNAPFKPVSETEHNEWFESVSNKNDMKVFTIVEKSSEAVIGSCSLRNINDHCRNAELQIRIGGANYRNKNYGTTAVLELLKFGFQDMNLRRIYLDVFETNKRAIRVYEKCGLSHEGIKRDAVFIDGEYINVVMMSILDDEFNPRNIL